MTEANFAIRKIDNKTNRLMLPPDIVQFVREAHKAESVYLTYYAEGVLAYPPTEFEVASKKLLEGSNNDIYRRMRKIFIGSAMEVKLDVRNRIFIPKAFRSRYFDNTNDVYVGFKDIKGHRGILLKPLICTKYPLR